MKTRNIHCKLRTGGEVCYLLLRCSCNLSTCRLHLFRHYHVNTHRFYDFSGNWRHYDPNFIILSEILEKQTFLSSDALFLFRNANRTQIDSLLALLGLIGPFPWAHSGPLCHALSLSSLSLASWTSMRRRRATVPLATSGELA